ncbi:MAG: PilC/PilY family type IV pilus protein [bacterium]
MCRYRSYMLIIITLIVSVLCSMIAPVNVWPESLEIRVNGANDDAEEYTHNGEVNLGSSDLEMVNETFPQIVGIRIKKLPVPHGAVITSAYLIFTTDETDSEPTTLTFRAEAVDDAPTFIDTAYNISSRQTTGASVPWDNVPAWGEVGEEHSSPNLSPIIQEVIDREGWASNNGFVFIITGSGKRTAQARNVSPDTGPILRIDYIAHSMDIRVCQSSDDAEEKADSSIYLTSSDLELVRDGSNQTVGIRFQNITVPQGALIMSAYIRFVTDETDSEETDLTIRAEAIDNASGFTYTSGNITSRSTTNASVSWPDVSAWSKVDECHQTPDLSSIIQEIVGRSGWVNGNSMGFIITGSGQRTGESYDGEPDGAPLLHISYSEDDFPYISVDKSALGVVCYEESDADPDTISITNTGSDTLEYTISDNAEWLSCSLESGTLSEGDSVTCTISYSTSSLSVGTHEATITITGGNAPNSPLEIDVSLTVEALPESNRCGHIPLYTETLVSPAIMILLDISGSMTNMMSINDEEDNPTTPDIKSIVQEIVNRDGWASGNAMSFIITGNGHRTAESFDGSSGSAPLLHVEYDSETVEVRVCQSSDDAEESESGGVYITSTDLELVNDGSDQAIGIRFQNVPIPKEATIHSAYMEFVIDEADSEDTSVTIWGEDVDNTTTFSSVVKNISNRNKTSASVAWNNIPEWSSGTQQSRIEIGRSVISELVKDRTISWGYGTWCSRSQANYVLDNDYTKIHIGCKSHDDAHQANLQAKIAATTTYSGTPFAYSIKAARKYFVGEKKDNDGTGEYYSAIGCQPQFLINVTDGLGWTSVNLVEEYTNSLCDAGVSPIAVGFGIDNATQIKKMAAIGNERGHASSALYALHDEVNGVGQPFLAYNKLQLTEALGMITERIKAQLFHGSAPKPTTSSKYGDIVIASEFDATDWMGDLVALTYNPETKEWDTEAWRASEMIPEERAVYTINPESPEAENPVIFYTDSVLPNDNWLCKDIGDIINSSPLIVGNPPFYYKFDNYESWGKSISRDAMVYIGSNDGALHAFSLSDGAEQWAFFPHSSQAKLNMADDDTYDMCSESYCHQYFVDGTPIAADIYTGSNWMTLLVCGLGKGGDSYFALDITSNKSFDQADSVKYLWEFTDSELGESLSVPVIERVRNGEGSTWGVFWGSGYSSTDQNNKEAYLYGIEAHNKAPLWHDSTCKVKIPASTLLDNILCSPLVADLDSDYFGDNIYVGDLYGTLYRVSNIQKGATPLVTKLFDFGNSSHQNPIRGGANYAYGKTCGAIWVYFGTGKFEVQADKSNMAQQYLIGVKDSLASPATYSLEDLVGLITSVRYYTDPDTGETQEVRTIEGTNASKASWALSLYQEEGERILEQPLIVANIIYFTTFVPDSDVCSGSGDTWLYALNYETGLAPETPVFDMNKDGLFNENDKIEGDEGEKENVGGIKIGRGQGSSPVMHKDTVFITTTDAEVTSMEVNMPGYRTRMVSWKDKTL